MEKKPQSRPPHHHQVFIVDWLFLHSLIKHRREHLFQINNSNAHCGCFVCLAFLKRLLYELPCQLHSMRPWRRLLLLNKLLYYVYASSHDTARRLKQHLPLAKQLWGLLVFGIIVHTGREDRPRDNEC